MEYVLLGTFILGLLLFVIAWLFVVVSGFQRHPVTGLVALVPGLNVLALPSLWHKVSGWVITGFIGVLLALVAWFAGASTHVYARAQVLGVDAPAPTVASATGETAVPPAEAVTHTIEIPAQARTPAAPEAATAPPAVASVPSAPEPQPALPAVTKDLPATALYHVGFQDIAVGQLTDHAGQYVRITQHDGRRREGKVLSATADAIELEERVGSGSVTLVLKLADIRSAAVMARKGEN